jgi:hypothetical protein
MTEPDTITASDCRRGFRAVYGSWAGTLICQGRDDIAIVALLKTSEMGLKDIGPGVAAVAARARDNIIAHPPELRKACAP